MKSAEGDRQCVKDEKSNKRDDVVLNLARLETEGTGTRQTTRQNRTG